MSVEYCPDCVAKEAELGHPSRARWVAPDGKVYCSLHFIWRFGHGERLVRVDGYEPPHQASKPVTRGVF